MFTDTDTSAGTTDTKDVFAAMDRDKDMKVL
jgi:hypothetical protein